MWQLTVRDISAGLRNYSLATADSEHVTSQILCSFLQPCAKYTHGSKFIIGCRGACDFAAMPTDEDDLEKGQGSVATGGTALTTEAPDLVWADKSVRLTLETGYRIRQHFHFAGMYYWLPRDVMTAVSYSGFVLHIQRRSRGIVRAKMQLIINSTFRADVVPEETRPFPCADRI
jgi:hypothetical protein